jgi:plasmid stabilization system protein ParE
MKVRYTPRAFADREAIFSYFDERNPKAAREFKAFIKARINGLAHLPHRNRLIAELGVHAHWLGRYPYVVYYRVASDEIRIVHIRHTSRRPWDEQ